MNAEKESSPQDTAELHRHILSRTPCQKVPHEKVMLPEWSMKDRKFVPEKY
jgi:hypothetical protein